MFIYNFDIFDDVYFFLIDFSIGLISGGFFDFEVSGDVNVDNVYELFVIVLDGVFEIIKVIKIFIIDIDGFLVCFGLEMV